MNPSNRTAPRNAADLRNQARSLRSVAKRLETDLLVPFVKYDAEFNSTPSDAVWNARQSCVADIRAKENCNPVELRKGIEGLRTKADRLDSEASELEQTALLESIVSRKLGGPAKVKPAQNPPGTKRLAA